MSEVGSMETEKADDKVSISQRIVDFLLCQETPPENAKPTPKGSAYTSPDKWDALRRAAEAATPGPWRVRKKINNDERDRTKITDIRWEIGAGTQTEPKQNKGHFHPEDEWYTSDETSVVETSMDRDYNDYEGGIGKQEDAAYIALANPAAILELLSELRGMPRQPESQPDLAVMSMAFHDVLCDFHKDDATFQETKMRYIKNAMAEMDLLEGLLPHFLEIAGMGTDAQPELRRMEGTLMAAEEQCEEQSRRLVELQRQLALRGMERGGAAAPKIKVASELIYQLSDWMITHLDSTETVRIGETAVDSAIRVMGSMLEARRATLSVTEGVDGREK